MTVTLNFKPEVEAGLLAQAQASGMSVEEYVLRVVEGTVLPAAKNRLWPEERAAAFEAWSAGHRPTPLLSDYAVSREAMYEGREHRCVSSLTRIFCCAAPNPITPSAPKPLTPWRSCYGKKTPSSATTKSKASRSMTRGSSPS